MTGKVNNYLEVDVVHIYMLSNDKGVIFYEKDDFLIFFTIVCCCARKYGISVVAFCIMLNHIHLAVLRTNIDSIKLFMYEVKTSYAREYNTQYSRKGALWQKSFGRSIVYDRKNKQTLAAYIYNNPVQKCICSKANEYRWNFLKYYNDKYPFSSFIPHDHASSNYRNALKILTYRMERIQPLNYALLKNLYKKLSDLESNTFKDCIISQYNCIDYAFFLSLYNDFNQMNKAFEYTVGKQYEINEYKGPASYIEFRILYQETKRLGYVGKARPFFKMTQSELIQLSNILQKSTKASQYHLNHYLHIGLEE